MNQVQLELGSQYTLKKTDFDLLLAGLVENSYQPIGPRVENESLVYAPIEGLVDLPRGYLSRQKPGSFRLTQTGSERYFDFIPGAQSWKQFLFPPTRELFSLRKNGNWEIVLPPGEETRYAFIGVRGCELAAIQIQDNVFIREDYVDPLYDRRRQDLFILAVNCLHPVETCFCASFDTGPRAPTGFDLSLTELDEVFLLEIGSEMGRALLQDLPIQACTAFHLQNAQKRLGQAAQEISRVLDSAGLPELILDNLDHPHWHAIAERCLSCANCTQVCPTCFCWDTVDTNDLSGAATRRERVWDSCFNSGHSYYAGGNTRPNIHARYRQWLSHKLATWQGQFDTPGCVGCGRCITWCPAGIDFTAEIQAFKKEAEA